MSQSFQIDSDKLQTVIDHFAAQAQAVQEIAALLAEKQAALRLAGDLSPELAHWLSQIDQQVFPSLDRLRGGLEQSGAALTQFLTQMTAMQPALEKLRQTMPQVQAAVNKVQARIEALKSQTPEEMLRSINTFEADQAEKPQENKPDESES